MLSVVKVGKVAKVVNTMKDTTAVITDIENTLVLMKAAGCIAYFIGLKPLSF